MQYLYIDESFLFSFSLVNTAEHAVNSDTTIPIAFQKSTI